MNIFWRQEKLVKWVLLNNQDKKKKKKEIKKKKDEKVLFFGKGFKHHFTGDEWILKNCSITETWCKK